VIVEKFSGRKTENGTSLEDVSSLDVKRSGQLERALGYTIGRARR